MFRSNILSSLQLRRRCFGEVYTDLYMRVSIFDSQKKEREH